MVQLPILENVYSIFILAEEFAFMNNTELSADARLEANDAERTTAISEI